MDLFFKNFFKTINEKIGDVNYNNLNSLANLIKLTNNNKKKVIIVGNGGSAAIASHFAVDLTKAANIRCVTFNESSLITCFSNDYGYEYWVEKALDFYAEKDDLVILISSSGNSLNIINGANKANQMGLPLVTLTGFNKNNQLSQLGYLNFCVDSSIYNIIENVHQVWLLSVIDFIIEKKMEI